MSPNDKDTPDEFAFAHLTDEELRAHRDAVDAALARSDAHDVRCNALAHAEHETVELSARELKICTELGCKPEDYARAKRLAVRR